MNRLGEGKGNAQTRAALTLFVVNLGRKTSSGKKIIIIRPSGTLLVANSTPRPARVSVKNVRGPALQ